MAPARPLFVVILAVAGFSSSARAAEICGNDVDDDNNGMTDEGCYPSLTTGVCESPLSCGGTGMVSWKTGSLHYTLPPDVAPKVPYGPGIGLRRFYTSMYTPGTGPSSVNHTPLGAGWQHTYMTWIDKYSVLTINRVILHTSQGRDVFYTYSSSSGGWDYYTPQAGEHVMSLKQNTVSPFQYQVQLLTGETLVYNSLGQLTEIWDSLSTPNKVLVTWDSTSNGNVSTVTDASGKRRLLFSYSNRLLSSIQYQVLISSVWTTEHTTSYAYNDVVSIDATSGWYLPATTAEWNSLLSGTTVPAPGSLWPMQDSTGGLQDPIGARNLSVSGTPSYLQTVAGWLRKAVQPSGTANYFGSSSTGVNPSSTSEMLLLIASLPAAIASQQCISVMGQTGAGSNGELALNNGKLVVRDGPNQATGVVDISSSVRVLVFKIDRGIPQMVGYVDGVETLKPTWQSPSSSSGLYIGGLNEGWPSGTKVLYGAYWTSNPAQQSDSNVAALISRIKNGSSISPTLSSVTIGGQLSHTNLYANGRLTKIQDGGGNQLVAFAYSSTTGGQVDLVTTSRGTVGLEYSSSRTGCVGNTLLYFNKGNSTSCNVDSDCGTGLLCGGKTGAGTTGTCFLAGRCLTLGTANNESVVTNVSPVGAGGGTCTGACTDVAQYVWSAGAGLFNVTGRQDPLGNYTSATYNSNGLPTQIAYGDADGDPTNGGYARTTYLYYDSTYPGRLAEVRRASDLDVNAASCSSTVTTGCARTVYTYAADRTLYQTTLTGTTLTGTGANAVYSYVSTYTHDSKGRLIQIDGPVSGAKTVYDYYTSSDPMKDQFLQDYKQYKDATNHLDTMFIAYDFWGNGTGTTDPDGTVSCKTFDSARGYLTQTRKAMAGQTDCSTSNSADLTTMWLRDSALRLIKLTRPDGSCELYSYDTQSRLYQTMRRDDCLAASSGDQQTFIYSADSQVTEIDTGVKDGPAPTRKQLFTYFNSRKLQSIVNPVDTAKFTGLIYDARGVVTEVDGAGSLDKTVFHFDGIPGRDRRITSTDRYTSASIYDTWTLLYDWLGDQRQMTDGDAKVTQSVRDDLGRLVKIVSADMSFPTVRVYDASGRITSIVEALGGGASQQTHSFTYDFTGRRLNAEYQGTCPTGTPHPEIQNIYDTAPGTCPITGGCNRTAGRLAYIKVILMCSSSYVDDGSLDQETFYSYDDDGRMLHEYVRDDSGRIADHVYDWTKNGALLTFTTPSTAVIGFTYGSTGNNSDTDRVTAIWRTSIATPVADTVLWFPYGPLQQYNQENHIDGVAGTLQRTRITRNLAYRITGIYDSEPQAGGTANHSTAITEDAKGRVITRDYSAPSLTGLFDSYFLYDQQDRVTCETTTFQSTCPTSGSAIKNNQSGAFTHAGDWQTLLRPIPGSTGGLTHQFDPSGYGTTHQITLVRQNDGTPALGDTSLAYDARGDRSYDDNTSTLTNDRRDYTYDARRNLVNVRGQYKTGGTWHYYDVASAFDGMNRRVFKSFYDETTLKTAQWFFYYDPIGRLTEVRYTPDTSAMTTYSVFQLFWINDRAVLYWQTDYPSVTTSKRYVGTDETNRPIDMWTWPASGNGTRVWAVNPSAWGFDNNLTGLSVYQPILFTGQYQDTETVAYENDGTTIHRPGLALSGSRTYDAFMGGYLQSDPSPDQTWSSYVYAGSDPVGRNRAKVNGPSDDAAVGIDIKFDSGFAWAQVKTSPLCKSPMCGNGLGDTNTHVVGNYLNPADSTVLDYGTCITGWGALAMGDFFECAGCLNSVFRNRIIFYCMSPNGDWDDNCVDNNFYLARYFFLPQCPLYGFYDTPFTGIPSSQ
jgi:hypothetical protein